MNCEVDLLARGVDDQPEPPRPRRAARAAIRSSTMPPSSLSNWRIALAPGRQAEKSPGRAASSKARDGAMVGAVEPRLAHVRDVEQAGGSRVWRCSARTAVGILDRHVVAGERHHARAELEMQRVQRGVQRGFGHRVRQSRKSARAPRQAADGGSSACGAPSVR